MDFTTSWSVSDSSGGNRSTKPTKENGAGLFATSWSHPCVVEILPLVIDRVGGYAHDLNLVGIWGSVLELLWRAILMYETGLEAQRAERTRALDSSGASSSRNHVMILLAVG